MLLFWVESTLILLGVSLRETYKHYWARWVGVKFYLIGQLPCVHVCLHDFLCIHFYALLLFCPSVCLSVCQPVLSIWPTLSHITNNHYHPQTALSLVPTSLSPLQNIFLPISLHIIFSCLQRNRDSWLSFILLIHGVAEANLQGTRQRLFVKLLFISFIKSSSSPIKEPRTVALDSHITLVSFGEMIYCLI